MPSSEVDCHHKYFNLWANSLSFKGSVLTILIILFAVGIECSVHSEPDADLKQQSLELASRQMPDGNSTDPETSPSIEQDNPNLNKLKTDSGLKWYNSNPSPAVRANRLMAATCLVIPLCIVFGIRIADKVAEDANVRYDCLKYLQSSIHTKWTWVTILNIIPFVIGCTAWLRAFVDCLLARWGKTLGGIAGWPPAAPLWWALFLTMLPALAIAVAFKEGVVKLMGSPDLDGNKQGEDIELGEEGRRLVDNIDGAGELEAEGPPAYDASWRVGGAVGSGMEEQLDDSETKSSNDRLN